MELRDLHPWDVTPKDAIAIQRRLAAQVVREGEPRDVRRVAGADCSIDRARGRGIGAVVVLSYPELEVVEVAVEETPPTFPYIPGLLSFREVPLLDPVRPIVSNRTSQLLRTAAELREEFSEQLRAPVFWAANVREMTGQGVHTFIETGPGHVLARMVRRVSDDVTAVSLDDAEVEPIPISVLPPASSLEAPST